MSSELEEPPVGRGEAQLRYFLTTCVMCGVWYFSDFTSLTSLLFAVLLGLGLARLQIAFHNRRWFSGR